jgi:class 3 adenylate cyclase
MPDTKYARSGDVSLAYQVVGDGPGDLVYMAGWVTNIEAMWEDPGYARFLRRLASFARLIMYDKRGVGLSDPVPADELTHIPLRLEDAEAVMDAAGSTSATMFGHSEGAATALQFAATRPDRVDRVIVTGGFAKRLRSEDYPWAPTWEERVAEAETFNEAWADPREVADFYAPSRADDDAFVAWLTHYLRMSASPSTAAAIHLGNSHIDVTADLPNVGAPTLLLYRIDDHDVNIEEGRYIASKVPDAKLIELPGADHFFWAGDPEPMLQEIEEFVTGQRGSAEPDRIVATAVFTDIVGSTELAASLGDKPWRNLLHRHDETTRRELARWRGRLIKTTGDGALATFDSPTQAIRFAKALPSSVEALGIEVRCGIHTGEMEILDDDVAGLAVHIAARISALTGPSEVLVSRTVKDLVAGTGIDMTSHGTHSLKGVPDEWEIYAVA